jgi:hypothetical protein
MKPLGTGQNPKCHAPSIHEKRLRRGEEFEVALLGLRLGESRLNDDRVEFVMELLPAVQPADDVRTGPFFETAGAARPFCGRSPA